MAHTETTRRGGRSLGRALAVLAVLLTTGWADRIARPASPPTIPQTTPPTTAPADLLDRLLPLAVGARRLYWGKPIVYNFDRPPDEKVWRSQGVDIEVRDGRWALTGNQRWWLERDVPAELIDKPAIRVDAWLELDLDPTITNRVGLYLAPTQSGRIADGTTSRRLYDFAMGATGAKQQLAAPGGDHVVAGAPLEGGRLLHVSWQMQGRHAIGQRGDAPPIVWEATTEARWAPTMSIGLSALCKEVRLVRMSLRGPGEGPELVATRAAALAEVGLADEAALDRLLAERLLTPMKNPSFRVRQEATQRLADLMPLSRGLIERKLAGGEALDPELRARLQWIIDQPAVGEVAPPVLVEAPPPPPATTRPEASPAAPRARRPEGGG